MSDQPSLIPDLPQRPIGRSSLEVFLTSLHSFMLRELKSQFGRSRLGYFWALAEPAATVAVLVGIHSMLGRGAFLIGGVSPVVFFVFGAVPYFIFANGLSKAQGVCESQKGLFNYRQIKPIDIILARCLIDALMMVGVLCVFLLCWIWLGNEFPVVDPLGLIMACLALFVLGAATGTIFEVFGTVAPDLRKVFSIVTRPLFFISGVFFSVAMLPVSVRPVLLVNPVLHGVELARAAVMNGYQPQASWVYLWGFAGVTIFVALASYRRYLDRII